MPSPPFIRGARVNFFFFSLVCTLEAAPGRRRGRTSGEVKVRRNAAGADSPAPRLHQISVIRPCAKNIKTGAARHIKPPRSPTKLPMKSHSPLPPWPGAGSSCQSKTKTKPARSLEQQRVVTGMDQIRPNRAEPGSSDGALAMRATYDWRFCLAAD